MEASEDSDDLCFLLLHVVRLLVGATKKNSKMIQETCFRLLVETGATKKNSKMI
jgi:hypothetical protein